MYVLLFWHGSVMNQCVKASILITQRSHLYSFLMLLIRTVLLTFCPRKKRLKTKDKYKTLISRNLKII